MMLLQSPLARLGCRLLVLLGSAALVHAQCEESKLFSLNGQPIDAFGWSVDVVGDVMVVGSLGEDDVNPANSNCNSGAAHVYERSGGTWTEVARLVASDQACGDQFGQDVEIAGNRILVTAHQHGAGAVYVFVNNGAGWVEEQKLVGSDSQLDFHFGHSASMAGDTVLVGVMRDTHAGNDSGAAFIFERAAGTWTETAKLIASNPQAGARFGRVTVMTEDTALVGAPFQNQSGGNSGAVYVYERNDAGTPNDPLDDTWPQADLLEPSNPGAGDLFGRSMAIEGDLLVIGASLREVGGVATGAALVFERQAGVWTQTAELSAADGEAQDEFGICVAVDGDRILVGARFDDDGGVDAGAMYVFERSSGVWVETLKFVASDAADGANLGSEMAIELDGDTAIIGSRFSPVLGFLTGEAYIVDLGGCLGEDYCLANANSTGLAGETHIDGSVLVANNDMTLSVSQLPTASFGYFLVSPQEGFFPLAGGSQGNLCLHGTIGRYINNVFNTGATGTGSLTIDLGNLPTPMGSFAAQPGQTLHFQAWHRDVVNGVTTSNFTRGQRVTVR